MTTYTTPPLELCKLKLVHALLPLQLGINMLSVWERLYISQRLTQITSCFAASGAWSGVTPLLLQASSTRTKFSSRCKSNLCNLTQRLHQTQSQKARNQKKNFFWEWGVGIPLPQTPLHAGMLCTYALTTYWNPLFKILATTEVVSIWKFIMRVVSRLNSQTLSGKSIKSAF